MKSVIHGIHADVSVNTFYEYAIRSFFQNQLTLMISLRPVMNIASVVYPR